MAGVGIILARRAVALTVALIIIVFLTGIIMEATGYAEAVWKAIINAKVDAYTKALILKAHGSMYCQPLGEAISSSTAKYTQINSSSYQAIISLDLSSSRLNYKSINNPPGLPEITILNLTVYKTNNQIYAPKIMVVVVRPDGLKIPVYEGTPSVSNATNINGRLVATTPIKIKVNTTYAVKELEKILPTKYPEVKSINITSSKVAQYLYGQPVKNGTTVVLKPLIGNYQFIIKFIYPSNVSVSKPADQVVVRIPPPQNCVMISQLITQYRAKLEKLYGLDKPWYDRVLPLVWRTLTFNLGETKQPTVTGVAGLPAPAPVSAVILACLPRTIVMLTIAEIICFAIAIPLAPKIAYHYGTLLDRLVVSYAALFNAIPVWWLGMVFILLFAYMIPIFPPQAMPIIDHINHFWQNPPYHLAMIIYYAALPIITIVITFLGSWLYSVRAVVLRIVREDYVMVAKAKGLPERDIIKKYIVRVAAPPIVTYVILALAGSLGGMIITESVFNYPGMGSLYYAAIQAGDVPTILGLTYVLTLVYIIARFILEVLYIYLDPRVRY
ncbi:MAG: ABC transporter permease [Crenarchaeota archaeon]|nr:ABC transporter permease [Thermoproteota archaeon]